MAWLEEHPTSGHFKICFRFGNRKLKKTIKTTSKRDAEGSVARFEENLRLLERGRIELPPGADIGTFLLSDGKLATSPVLVAPARPLLLKDLCDLYIGVQSNGPSRPILSTLFASISGTSRKPWGNRSQFPLWKCPICKAISTAVRESARRPLSAVTLRKEMATFRACWSWGVQAGKLKDAFPGRGLKYPKTDEKPPFQTRADIERRLARGGQSVLESRELWHSLFLHRTEIDEMLAFVRTCQAEPFLYPMICLAAHTGAGEASCCDCGSMMWISPVERSSCMRKNGLAVGRAGEFRCRRSPEC